MSLRFYILFDGKLPSKAALAQCFKQLGFPLAFERGADLVAQHLRHLPMRLRGEETGFALGIGNSRQDVEDIVGEEIDPRFTRAVSVSSAGGEADAAASCFAAALAKLVNGLVLRSYSDVDLTPDRAIALARRDLDATAERFRRPGTGPAEMRRYLESLLRQRRDLLLIGRRLLVRPVRHLLRGALLNATGDTFELRVGPYIMPLYDGSPDSIGYLGHVHDEEYKVWRRNFVPLLIDALGEEIFEPLGRIGTIADFAARCLHEPPGLWRSGTILTTDDFIARRRSGAHPTGEALVQARITALVLAGEVDRAAAYVEHHDQETEAHQGVESVAKLHFNRLVKDVAATCAEYRAREVDLVKAMKLERIWERAPFPVEVPAPERSGATAEPLFAIAPWPARPPGLREEGPTQPGEVRYAEDYFWRGETLMLRAVLTPEQAEERHRAVESYVLVVRLPDGRLLTVSHSSTFDRNDPDGPPRGHLDATFYIGLHGGAERIFANASSTYLWREHPDLIQIFSIERYRESGRIWLGYFLLHEDKRDIYDWRSGEQVYASSPLPRTERDLCMFRKPGCGEYAIFIERIEALLRLADQPVSPESRTCVDASAPEAAEIDVAFHGNLPGKAALAQMFEQFGFPLSFQHSSGRLAQHDGHLPMRLRGKEADVEFDTWDVRGVFETFFGKEAVPHLAYSASFAWSNKDERTVAICLAAALAKLKDGLVEGLLPDRKLTADEAIASAREELEGTEGNGN